MKIQQKPGWNSCKGYSDPKRIYQDHHKAQEDEWMVNTWCWNYSLQLEKNLYPQYAIKQNSRWNILNMNIFLRIKELTHVNLHGIIGLQK